MIFFTLFITFFKIGLFTFGGGYAMLPLIQAEVVSQGWINENQIIDFIAVSESTPGPFAINIATYIGTETGGFFGAVCTTLGVVLPSFIVILIVARFYEKYKSSHIIQGVMSGLKPAVIGLIGSAVLTVGRTVFLPAGTSFAPDAEFFCTLGIFAAAVFLLTRKVHPIVLIGVSAGLGIILGYAFLG